MTQHLILLLTKALARNDLNIPPQAMQKLVHYLELMCSWNKVFNLTNITDPTEMVYLHLLDSLVINPYLHGTECLDVGTGAGLPGIPLAIINPEQSWTLLDKNNKKTRFLTQVVAELSLANVTVIHSRTEDFQHPAGFDSILSRAFGTLRLFANTTHHLLKPTGALIAMKGKYPQEELADLPKDFNIIEVVPLHIKGLEAERHLVRLLHQ